MPPLLSDILMKLLFFFLNETSKMVIHTACIWFWMAKDVVILVHTWLVEADTTISSHFLWAEMEIILFIYFYPPR